MARNAILKADPAASAPLSKLQIQFFLKWKENFAAKPQRTQRKSSILIPG
jgi:hypothetical protein